MRYMGRKIDFSAPEGAPALQAPDSVSWRVFANPVSVVVGGIAAVLLELAEPRVRTGVWEHSTFRDKPFDRMKRTGMAAMITVYAPRETAEAVIAGVTRMHARVSGETPDGAAYTALDTELLDWVHATASFGFLSAYYTYAAALPEADHDRFFAEGRASAALYGAAGAPASVAGWEAMLARFTPLLEPSDILQDFIHVTRKALPMPGPLADAFIGAAVDLLPEPLIKTLILTPHRGNHRQLKRIRQLARMAERFPKPGTPAAQAKRRMRGTLLDDIDIAKS